MFVKGYSFTAWAVRQTLNSSIPMGIMFPMGYTIEDLAGTANAIGTIALNRYEGGKAAQYLEKEFGIPAIIGPTPIGIRNTDTFLQNPVNADRETGSGITCA